MTDTPLLSVEHVTSGYDDVTVLHDVSFAVKTGAIVAIVGANGAGKTTLLSTIAGLVRPRQGQIQLRGAELRSRAANELPRLGMAMVPEGGRLFPFMTVLENLELGGYSAEDRQSVGQRLDEVMSLFPVLGERRSQLAGRLSGGERQMCAIARALMSRPTLLLLDEPSVGLSPLMTERVLETVALLARREGLTVVIVEQRVAEVLAIAHEGHILDHGRIVGSGKAAQLLNDQSVQATYMGL